jgi:hypothetical protein
MRQGEIFHLGVEAGNFSAAIETGEEAARLARSVRDVDLARELEAWIKGVNEHEKAALTK